MAGPLKGIRVVEFEGIGPAPYCGMLLADLGADVVRIARPHAERGPLIQHRGDEPIDRGRSVVQLNLKSEEGLAGALALLERSDAMIEGLRPGVMERLGLGPEVALAVHRAVLCGLRRRAALRAVPAPQVQGRGFVRASHRHGDDRDHHQGRQQVV